MLDVYYCPLHHGPQLFHRHFQYINVHGPDKQHKSSMTLNFSYIFLGAFLPSSTVS